VHALAVKKLGQIDTRIADLIALRTQLHAIVAQWGSNARPDSRWPARRVLESLLNPPSRKAYSHDP
jgi:hypothetical protein